ncbi:hypothetical protein [Planomonospora sp. ID82291]|uniref:hypothetical protein n=1 Tax=Planomonospora sp. ID82291 TaxID=2738136 RepID=UPI0018C43885|nr:hypothetical protein [Planomonospora sp. ID82291]MBG0818761.1 hypothetical protein [Planomonospora sp. ID82291]
MAKRSNSFNGGTSGAAITLDNSGGASGDALDTYSEGTAPVFSAVRSYSGSLSAYCADEYTSMKWSFTGGTTIYTRQHLYLTAYPGDSELFSIGTASNTVRGLRLSSSGQLSLWNYLTSFTPVVTLTSAVVPLNRWVRVETRTGINVASPAHEIRLALNPALADYQSASATGTQTTQTPTSYSFMPPALSWCDDLSVSDEGWIGMLAVANEPRPAVLTAAAVQRSTCW